MLKSQRRSRTLLRYSAATYFMERPNEISVNFKTVAQKSYTGMGCDFSNVGLSPQEVDVF
jgi:hypothetical protein